DRCGWRRRKAALLPPLRHPRRRPRLRRASRGLSRPAVNAGFRLPSAPPALPPRVSLERERALIECLLSLHEHRAIRSAHDLANRGLAVALAECATDGPGCHG